jgi:hypothetical protein
MLVLSLFRMQRIQVGEEFDLELVAMEQRASEGCRSLGDRRNEIPVFGVRDRKRLAVPSQS